MFYLFGYAEVEAHGDLLLHVLGNSRGRGAEYFGPGPDSVNLKTDRWIWTNEVSARSVKWLAAQSPEFRSYLDAFAAGINAAAAAHPETLAPEVRQVLPITALDLIQHEQHFYNFEFTASRTLAVSNNSTHTAALLPPTGFEPAPEDLADGSNGWAIAPSHTTSGHAMMLLNPHLAWGGEQTYFEVHLTAPGINLYGATQIGVPVLRFVFTDQLAITNTVNTNNGHILYRITEAEGGYRFDGKTIPYTSATYPVKVLQPDGTYTTESVEVLKTVHGPIIRRDDGAPIALYAAGLDKPFLLEQIWKMDTSHNFVDYQNQLRRLQIPMYNILYADRDGHIEYLFNAPIPRRASGDYAFWSKPVPGDTSALLPTGTLTYEELPKLIDPPSGYVQNSNEPPWDAAYPTPLRPADYPAYVSPIGFSFRADRALRMLSEDLSADGKFTFPMLLDKKLSTRAEMADRLLPDLLAAVDQYGSPRAKQAAAILRAWDRSAEATSTGTILFNNWANRFGTSSDRNYAIPYDVSHPLTTPSGLKDPAAAALMLDAAAEATLKTFGQLDKPWGDYLRLQINAQSTGDTHIPRGTALNAVDLPGNGGPGAIGIFRVVTPGPILNGASTPVHGDGFTIALEFTTPIHARAFSSEV
jgi:acyl-homoserine-lactone acylase